MRAPRRRRPPLREIATQLDVDLHLVAEKVRYVGSPEHKDAPSFAGQPRPRADASICDRRFSRMQYELTIWLRSAIVRGAVSTRWDLGFPRYVWFKDGEIVYEARIVNAGRGEYKGYPLQNSDEWPRGIGEIYV